MLTVDHALGLIIRGLAGQQLMPCEVHPNYAKYHTIIYLDILASVKATGESWRSRVSYFVVLHSCYKIMALIF